MTNKGMQHYKTIHFILTSNGRDIPSQTLLANEEIKNSVDAILMKITDLRIPNAVLDLTDYGYSRSEVPRHVNEAIERLYLDRVKEIIDGTTDIKLLKKWNKQLDSRAKKYKGGGNHFRYPIYSRIEELSE